MTAAPTTDSYVVSSTPYPWPWNGELAGPGTAAVVVVPRGGWPAVAEACAQAARSVVSAIVGAGGTAIVVTTAAPGRSPAPGPVDPMNMIYSQLGLGPDQLDSVLAADGIDGFSGSSLEGVLRSRAVARLVLVGAGLETCIHSTMRSANDRGFECLLVTDASAPYDPSLVPASISMIEMSGGIFGAAAASADVIRAFLNPGA